jgi:hypothetical protein
MTSWRRALLSLVLSSTALGAQAASPGPTANARDVRLRIETSRATYRTGDSVTVRLALTNESTAPITFVAYPPWYQARLMVTDATGRVVAPTMSPSSAYLVSSRKATLPGGQTRVRSWENQEWFSLRHWGYKLDAPGQYTIVGAPALNVPGVAPDTTLRSNRVTITITPR